MNTVANPVSCWTLAESSPYFVTRDNGQAAFDNLCYGPFAEPLTREVGFIKRFEQDPSVDEQVRTLVVDMLKQKQHLIVVKSPLKQRTIYVPTNLGIDRLADYYSAKYGITIKLWDEANFIERLKEWQQSKSPETIGIVVCPEGFMDTSSTSHVTPFLLQNKTVLSLDSVAASIMSVTPHLLLLDECIEFFHLGDVRQADYYSCRTDALVILRNALIDIKQREQQGKTVDLRTIVQSKETLNWRYTDQISSKEFKEKQLAAQSPVIRDFFSHNPEKRASPQPMDRLRASKTEEASYEYSFKRRLIKGNELTFEPFILWKETRSENSYLLHKGEHFARLLSHPTQLEAKEKDLREKLGENLNPVMQVRQEKESLSTLNRVTRAASRLTQTLSYSPKMDQIEEMFPEQH